MLLRRRNIPRQYEVGKALPEYPASEKDRYRTIYLQAIDLVNACIQSRFEQRGFQMLQKLETVN